MPMMSAEATQVLAGATTVNVLAGLAHEFLQGPAKISLAATCSALGVNCTFQIGSRTIIDDQPIPATNAFPVLPDDLLAGDFGLANQRLLLRFRNTTVGNLNYFYRVDVQY